MDIKLRNISSTIWFKLITVLLCVVGMLLIVYSMTGYDYLTYIREPSEYKNSYKIREKTEAVYSKVVSLAVFKNEENIKSGKTITDERVRREKNEILREKYNVIEGIKAEYAPIIENAKAYNNSDEANLIKERDELISKENENFERKIAQINEKLINDDLWKYKVYNKEVAESGMFYTIVSATDGKIADNTGKNSDPEAFYNSLPFHIKSQNGSYAYYGPYGTYSSQDYSEFLSGTTIYVGVSESEYAADKKIYESDRKQGLGYLYMTVLGAVAFLLGYVLFLVSAGRRKNSKDVHLTVVDRLYLDVGAFVLLMPVLGLILFVGIVPTKVMLTERATFMYVASPAVIAGVLVSLLYSSIFIKHFKRGTVLKNTLVFAALRSIKRIFKGYTDQYGKAALSGQTVLFITTFFIVYNIAVAFSLFLLYLGLSRHRPGATLFALFIYGMVNLLMLMYIIKRISYFKVIAEGVKKIKGGQLAWRIPEGPSLVMTEVSDDINNIAQGLGASVENELKAERMKAELITNVSHDLKTPLTSIITYVDLLKKEGLNSENASKYLEILDVKSARLKKLTEDLFDAAKASSGNIAVKKEELDIVSLVKQGFGELADKVEASGLEFITSFPSEKIMVKADGKLLWRVVDNLMSNVFKYAMPASRVYVSVFRENGFSGIVIKNISEFPLNIPAEELMERFKRGDESRHSEGSGLGLAIARGLTELQGGKLTIDIDGDLFKATVKLPVNN